MTDITDPTPVSAQPPATQMAANAAAIIAAVVTDFEEGVESVMKAISDAQADYAKWAVANPMLVPMAEQAVRVVIGRLASCGLPVEQVEAIANDIFSALAAISTQAAVQQVAIKAE